MDSNQVGFSNIRLPNNSNNYIYTYNSNINIFPEEVFIHEFLHSLERNLIERGYNIPALHDNAKYGYDEQVLIGLKNWYEDYMQCNINNNETGSKIGLDPIVYTLKPAHESNFQYSITKEFNKEPNNIIEEIKCIINSIGSTLKQVNNSYERAENESIGI